MTADKIQAAIRGVQVMVRNWPEATVASMDRRRRQRTALPDPLLPFDLRATLVA